MNIKKLQFKFNKSKYHHSYECDSIIGLFSIETASNDENGDQYDVILCKVAENLFLVKNLTLEEAFNFCQGYFEGIIKSVIEE